LAAPWVGGSTAFMRSGKIEHPQESRSEWNEALPERALGKCPYLHSHQNSVKIQARCDGALTGGGAATGRMTATFGTARGCLLSSVEPWHSTSGGNTCFARGGSSTSAAFGGSGRSSSRPALDCACLPQAAAQRGESRGADGYAYNSGVALMAASGHLPAGTREHRTRPPRGRRPHDHQRTDPRQ
jgi:hypothetical protein